jgi:hypothetical protein
VSQIIWNTVHSESLLLWTVSIVRNSKCKKHNSSETESVSVLGLGGGGRERERDLLCWTQQSVSLSSPEDGNRSSFRNVAFCSIQNCGRCTSPETHLRQNPSGRVVWPWRVRYLPFPDHYTGLWCVGLPTVCSPRYRTAGLVH